MKILVGKHEIKIDKKDKVNQNEYKVTKCEFEFDEEITNDLVKVALFTNSAGTYKVYITNNECDIPPEILEKQETTTLGVYAYKVNNDELELRYSPEEINFFINNGSYRKNATNSEPITPTDKEQMEQAIQEMEEKIDNLDIDAEKVNKTTTITITKKDGSQEQVEIEDGIDGIGLNYNWSGTSLGVKREDEQNYQYTNLKGDKGDPGAIKFQIVEELPTTQIEEDTIYLVPYDTITVQELPSNPLPHTIYIVESTNKRYIYESNQWIEITSDNKYVEYIYVNNQWEELGSIGVDIDLTDYYTKSETNSLLDLKNPLIDSNNKLSADLVDDTNTTNKFTNASEKETWNNKVGTTDYASSNVGGVIKVTSDYGINTSDGNLRGVTRTYAQYINLSNYSLISKGTLENVIVGKDLTTKAYVDGLVGDIATTLDTINREVV